jgi:hypothetical protein
VIPKTPPKPLNSLRNENRICLHRRKEKAANLAEKRPGREAGCVLQVNASNLQNLRKKVQGEYFELLRFMDCNTPMDDVLIGHQQWSALDMLSDREEITHALDHAPTAIAALRSANEDNETLKQIEDAMDSAYAELTRRAPS